MLIVFTIIFKEFKYVFLTKNRNKIDTNRIGFYCMFLSFLIYGIFESNLIISASVIASLFWIVSGIVSAYE